MKKINSAQIEKFNAAIVAEFEAQKEKAQKAQEAIAALDATFKATGQAPDQDTVKTLNDALSNANQRMRYAQKLINLGTEKTKMLLACVVDHAQLVRPHNLYNIEHGLLQMFNVVIGATAPDNKGLNKMACFFVPFSKALTVDFGDLDKAVKKAIANTGNRWNGAYSDALRVAGAATLNMNGKKIGSVTIDPDHFLIKGLQEKMLIGKLADH